MEFKESQPSKKLAMATEAELERNNQIVQELIDESIKQRANAITLREEIERDIVDVTANLESYADGEEKFRPVLGSLFKSKARLDEGIVYLDSEIAEYQEHLARAKREDEERRRKLLSDFDGTKQ